MRTAEAFDAIYSRLPFQNATSINIGAMSLPSATIEVNGALLRVLGVHVANPIRAIEAWRADLRNLRDFARGARGPLLMAGDFNANRWNPQFADLLEAGLHDGVEATGRGLTFSWPIDRFLPCPIMRLDHALGSPRLCGTHDHDVTIAGSDHRGLITTWAIAADP